jgi:urea transport system ATP-binding protein
MAKSLQQQAWGNPLPTLGEPILRIEQVTVHFGAFTSLAGLDLTLDRGELRVVIGPNGAGKTTLLDVITGKVRPARGRVLFQHRRGQAADITGLPEPRIARLGIGRKFQTPNLFNSLSVLDNLKLALRGRRSVLCSLFAPFTRDDRARVQDILHTIGLAANAAQPAGILAHGEKQWLDLGMLMAQESELLLIDEPVAGMTPKESERTGELLLSLARQHTLLVIDHDMTFVRQIASKVTVLDDGKIICEGSVDEVHRDPRVIEVYLGHNHQEATTIVRPITASPVAAADRPTAGCQ